MAYTDTPELIQHVTTIISLICAFATNIAYYAYPKWRKLNYFHVKQIAVKCAATCCMVAIIIFPEELFSRDALVTTYFAIVLTTVLGTVHIIGLGHIHVALNCEEIQYDEMLVQRTWYCMIAQVGFIIYCVMSILALDLLTVDCVMGILTLAISLGNWLLLSRIFKLVGKCNASFMFSVNVLGILCDVFLILYGGLLINGDNVGLFNSIVKVTFTTAMVIQTVLLLCSKDAMDWNKFSKVRDENIEM